MIEIIIFILGAIFGGIIIWYSLKNKNEIQINAILNEANVKLSSLKTQKELEKKYFEDRIKTLSKTKDEIKKD